MYSTFKKPLGEHAALKVNNFQLLLEGC